MDTKWIEVFTGLDTGVTGSIAVLAFLMQRSKRCSDDMALLIPVVLGAFYGLLDGLDAGWAINARLLKGAFLYGAGAAVTARLLHVTIGKLWAEPVA